VLDDGTLRRLGGQKVHALDVRVIAATNMDLERATRDRRFREDLFYRLSVIRIHLPPLRERVDDIEPLCQYFLRELAPDQEIVIPPEEVDQLRSYRWPGNVRELKNIIDRAVILRSTNQIYPGRLLLDRPGDGSVEVPGGRPPSGSAVMTLAEIERQHIEQTLAVLDHNHTRAAQALGISRSTLLRKLAFYNIQSGDPK